MKTNRLRQHVSSFSQELQIREASYKQAAYSDHTRLQRFAQRARKSRQSDVQIKSQFVTQVCHLFRDLGAVHVR